MNTFSIIGIGVAVCCLPAVAASMPGSPTTDQSITLDIFEDQTATVTAPNINGGKPAGLNCAVNGLGIPTCKFLAFTMNSVVSGDVIVTGTELGIPDMPTDLIRFIDNGGGQSTSFQFFSDKDGDTDVSDIGLPTSTTTFKVAEDGKGLASYSATATINGKVVSNTIRLHSDCSDCIITDTPEPNMSPVLSVIAAVFMGTGWRKLTRRATPWTSQRSGVGV